MCYYWLLSYVKFQTKYSRTLQVLTRMIALVLMNHRLIIDMVSFNDRSQSKRQENRYDNSRYFNRTRVSFTTESRVKERPGSRRFDDSKWRHQLNKKSQSVASSGFFVTIRGLLRPAGSVFRHLHQFGELFEEVVRVVGAGGGFGVVLHREAGQLAAADLSRHTKHRPVSIVQPC
jgi:hypothetical protein